MKLLLRKEDWTGSGIFSFFAHKERWSSTVSSMKRDIDDSEEVLGKLEMVKSGGALSRRHLSDIPVAQSCVGGKMLIWNNLLVFCVVVHAASPLLVASVKITDNGFRIQWMTNYVICIYEELCNMLMEIEGQRADVAEQKWDEKTVGGRVNLCEVS